MSESEEQVRRAAMAKKLAHNRRMSIIAQTRMQQEIGAAMEFLGTGCEDSSILEEMEIPLRNPELSDIFGGDLETGTYGLAGEKEHSQESILPRYPKLFHFNSGDYDSEDAEASAKAAAKDYYESLRSKPAPVVFNRPRAQMQARLEKLRDEEGWQAEVERGEQSTLLKLLGDLYEEVGKEYDKYVKEHRFFKEGIWPVLTQRCFEMLHKPYYRQLLKLSVPSFPTIGMSKDTRFNYAIHMPKEMSAALTAERGT